MIVDVLRTAAVLCVVSIPLAVTVWALLDAAKRPAWVWAFAERRQVVWMTIIALGIVTVIGGLMISGWYLLRIRPTLAKIEDGDLTSGG